MPLALHSGLHTVTQHLRCTLATHLPTSCHTCSSASPSHTQAWLDPFLRETVSGMLLWPRRMVVPLLDEKLTGPLDDLYLR